MLSYALRLSGRYDGMVIAAIPDVPEARAIGRDDEEACEQALGALEAVLETYHAEGRPIPEPRATGSLQVTTTKYVLALTEA
ncbi:type II toxin-antitoxin system HicB family antitoxin [Allosphingosinicella sp.]|uniref:type II toxin-antitoxin system HicB family antitoxin n=1 Tax=Allosphingosinicella sp. TaxID=2823234 RepID=UPI002FC209AC